MAQQDFSDKLVSLGIHAEAAKLIEAASLQPDSTGIVNVNLIPRTGTLASLQTLAGGVGEISEATDYPYLIKHNGVVNGAAPISFKRDFKVLGTKAPIVADARFIKCNWSFDGTETIVNPPAINWLSSGNPIPQSSIFDNVTLIDSQGTQYECYFDSVAWHFRKVGNTANQILSTTFSDGSIQQIDVYGNTTLFGIYASPFGKGDFCIGSGDAVLQSQITQVTKSTLRGQVSTAASVELTTTSAAPATGNALVMTTGPFAIFELSYTLIVFNPAIAGQYYIVRTTVPAMYQTDVTSLLHTQIVAPTVVTSNTGLTLTSAPTFAFNSAGKLIVTVPKVLTGSTLLSCACFIETKVLFN